jgi:hypothetical protein
VSDNITLPREAVEKIHEAWSSEVYPPATSIEWYDIMDALRAALAAPRPEPVRVEPTPPITRFTCGFVDVRFNGDEWFCEMCGERMNEHYEEMVKHSNGKDYLELMQRKAAFKIRRDKP